MKRAWSVDIRRCGRRGANAFTLIELLIVIGLLGALAVLLLSNLTLTRTEALDTSIVQKELSDIQRAFQRFRADCVPTQADYKRIAQYGLEILCEYEGREDNLRGWSFDYGWDPAKGKGWRGPYVQMEGTRTVNTTVGANGVPAVDDRGQPESAGGTEIPVVCTPYVDDADGHTGDYYRVIPELDDLGETVTQLWLVFPSHSGQLDDEVIDRIAEDSPDYESGVARESAKRRLLLN
jgi:prepilin-type N-terminal cleavage/methylation domain-containing protein